MLDTPPLLRRSAMGMSLTGIVTMERMMRSAIALGMLAIPGSASAQDIVLTPIADARLRYETVDQAGLRNRAQALTLRIRPGVQATRSPLSALIETQATIGIVDRYNDGLNNRAGYPLVADPQTIQLNRGQVRYAPHTGQALTVGRQRIELLDQRFVASSPFRQNGQTFDAARVEWTGPAHLSTDVTYAWSTRTTSGIDGRGARPSAIGGGNVFALASYAHPLGTLTGFAFLVDQDDIAVQRFQLSSQTYGARAAGSRKLGSATLAYAASWARQSDYHRNPNRYRADYWLVEGGLAAHGLSGTAGLEVLGADRGVPLTSVQTPLGSGFKFQGWADRFTTDPPDGVRDLYGTLAATRPLHGRVSTLSLSATYHRFASDRVRRLYGDEIDLLATAKVQHYSFSARYARYAARSFATDTDKFWLALEWAL